MSTMSNYMRTTGFFRVLRITARTTLNIARKDCSFRQIFNKAIFSKCYHLNTEYISFFSDWSQACRFWQHSQCSDSGKLQWEWWDVQVCTIANFSITYSMFRFSVQHNSLFSDKGCLSIYLICPCNHNIWEKKSWFYVVHVWIKSVHHHIQI